MIEKPNPTMERRAVTIPLQTQSEAVAALWPDRCVKGYHLVAIHVQVSGVILLDHEHDVMPALPAQDLPTADLADDAVPVEHLGLRPVLDSAINVRLGQALHGDDGVLGPGAGVEREQRTPEAPHLVQPDKTAHAVGPAIQVGGQGVYADPVVLPGGMQSMMTTPVHRGCT